MPLLTNYADVFYLNFHVLLFTELNYANFFLLGLDLQPATLVRFVAQERTKRALLKHDVMLEGLGGDIQAIPISALKVGGFKLFLLENRLIDCQ